MLLSVFWKQWWTEKMQAAVLKAEGGCVAKAERAKWREVMRRTHVRQKLEFNEAMGRVAREVNAGEWWRVVQEVDAEVERDHYMTYMQEVRTWEDEVEEEVREQWETVSKRRRLWWWQAAAEAGLGVDGVVASVPELALVKLEVARLKEEVEEEWLQARLKEEVEEAARLQEAAMLEKEATGGGDAGEWLQEAARLQEAANNTSIARASGEQPLRDSTSIDNTSARPR